MKLKKIKSVPSSAIVLFVATVMFITVTLALFINSVSLDRSFKVSNFRSNCVVYFDNGASRIDCSGANNIEVSLDRGDDNFIGNLRVNVQYSGCGVGLVRARIIEEWSTFDSETNTRTVVPYQIAVPYLTGTPYDNNEKNNQKAWYDNRNTDYYMYYATAVRGYSESKPESIPLITGLSEADMDFDTIPRGTELHITIQTDIVQVNRYPQFWKMTSLPWNGADSSTEVVLNES